MFKFKVFNNRYIYRYLNSFFNLNKRFFIYISVIKNFKFKHFKKQYKITLKEIINNILFITYIGIIISNSIIIIILLLIIIPIYVINKILLIISFKVILYCFFSL